MYLVYVLKSLHFKKTYVGITDNEERRLKQHNLGHHAYTNRFKPWIIFYKELYSSRDQARKREKYFKSASGRRWLKKFVFNTAGMVELVDTQS